MSRADGGTLPGATISVNGKGVNVTNADGRFQLQVPAGSEVSFTSVGFQTHRFKADRNETNLVIYLENAQKDLNEVVVTALGIKREEKALGYSVSTIKEDQITQALPNNWSDALKGKVAGLNILQTGSGPLNSARITLRGDRSLDPNKNEALIVVDGIPMINGKVSSGVDQAYGAGASGADKDIPIDFGNGLGDINPDDIETVTVLKGAAATALYGSRAGNGALVITTKSGKRKGKGVGVTVNSNFSVNDVLRWPEYQYEYGQGNLNRNATGELYYSYGLSADGPNTGSTSSAFGPKFNGQQYFQYDPDREGQSPERRLWQPYKDNIKGFWQTGHTFTNSVAVEGGSDNFTARASITHTTNEWIMPNTGFNRLVASLNTGISLSKRLKLNTKLSYTSKNSDNLPGTGYNNQSIAYFMIFQNPNVDLAWYEPRWKKGQYQIQQIHPFSSYIENPYVIAYDMINSLNSTNIIGNIQAQYTLSPKLELMVRSGLNTRQDRREQNRPWNTANFPQGYYKQQDVMFMESNTDALLTYKDRLSNNFDVTASIGGNRMSNEVKQNNAVARGLLLPGVYKLSNALEQSIADNILTQRQINSVYGLVNLGWRDMIFVDITGRNDWSSTLPSSTSSYFYPSVSTSYVLSDLFALPSVISFAKARLSWAQVGTDTDPYRTAKYYDKSTFPGSANSPSTLFNGNLKPEISTSWEAGLNIYLFKKRINADLNFYSNTTVNQVLMVPMDVTTGFGSAFINGGNVRNQGVEVMLSGQPVQSKNFTWGVTATWAKNKNEILALSDAIESNQQIIATSGNASIIATKGGSTGDIWGYGLVRNELGQVVFDGATGLAVRPTDITRIGNAYANWRGGLQNEFAYKNLKLNVLLDGQYGGIIYSQTHHKMTEQGKLKHTLYGRETMTIVGDGVVQNEDGSYSPNTKPVAINTWYADYYRRANVETNSLDASYLKLREVRLEYALPRSLVSRWKISGASIAFFGRDLAMISKFPIFDPETASLNGATVVPGVEMGQLPTPRTWGINLNLKL
ncbi:SusC/RagA family TonB-linked outer membrane protein [Spirosoma pomorum]